MAVHSCFGRSVLWSKCALVAVCFGRRVHSRCSAPEALSQLPDERRQADTQSACSLYIGTRRWPPIDHTAHAVAAHHRPRGGGRLRRCRQARGPRCGTRRWPASARSDAFGHACTAYIEAVATASRENLRLFAQTRMQRVCRKDRAPRASPALTTGPPPLISSWVSRLAWPLALEWPPRACWCPRAFTTAQLGASPQPTPSRHKHLRCHTQ